MKMLSLEISLADSILKILYENNIQSVLIEGGTTTLQTFINEGLWDEARIFNGSVKFQNGLRSPKIKWCYCLLDLT